VVNSSNAAKLRSRKDDTMIYGVEPTTLEILKNSEFNFYLTGSRFFNSSRVGSDWDFFVEVPEGGRCNLIKFLKSNRFYAVNDYLADDRAPDRVQELLAVYKNDEENIHIQIVENAAKKNSIQGWIKSHCPEFNSLPKGLKFIVWRFAYRLYNAGV